MKRVSGPLMILFFIVGAGALVASGIYLETSVSTGGSISRILRTVLFGLVGILLMLMYGQAIKSRSTESESPPASQDERSQ